MSRWARNREPSCALQTLRITLFTKENRIGNTRTTAMRDRTSQSPPLRRHIRDEIQRRPLASVEPRVTCPKCRLLVHAESRPWLHQGTTILSETRLLDSLARAVSKDPRKSSPQTTQNKRPDLINLTVEKVSLLHNNTNGQR
jgi:hypothetical protein